MSVVIYTVKNKTKKHCEKMPEKQLSRIELHSLMLIMILKSPFSDALFTLKTLIVYCNGKLNSLVSGGIFAFLYNLEATLLDQRTKYALKKKTNNCVDSWKSILEAIE